MPRYGKKQREKREDVTFRNPSICGVHVLRSQYPSALWLRTDFPEEFSCMLVQDDVVLFVVQLLGGGQNEVQLIVHEVRKERDLSEKILTNHSSRAFVSNSVHGPIEHVKHP